MQNFFNDVKVLNKVYYNGDNKLSKRIDMWNMYGTNKISYKEFIFSLLDNQYECYADLGCGNAFYSSEILNFVTKEVFLCDVSSNMLKNAEERINNKNINTKPKIIFLNENLLSTSISDNSCDLVTLMHVLHHINNFQEAINEVKRITKKGATVIITTYNNSLTDWLNKTHYKLLKELDFPEYMLNKSDYLAFAGNNAIDILKKNFENIIRIDYNNDAIINNNEAIMNYYSSAMMYRMSMGYSSKDIDSKKWKNLYNKMKSAVDCELKEKGDIVIEGNITAFKITI